MRLQVDQWLDYAAFLTAGPGFEAACAALDAYLAFRSFLVGYNLTIADLACWGQLESRPNDHACYCDTCCLLPLYHLHRRSDLTLTCWQSSIPCIPQSAYCVALQRGMLP